MPPATLLTASPNAVAAFIACEANRDTKPASFARRLAAIGDAHRSADLPDLTESAFVRKTLAGIRRCKTSAIDRKAPITADLIRALVDLAPPTLAGLRDRALLLLGFAARSENANDV